MSDALPEGWATARLDEIAALNPRHSRDLDDKQAVTFVPMPAVSETSPLLDTSQERALESVRTGYTHFAEGDVLFAKITPCMENGKGAVATGLRNGLGCGTTELHVVRPHAGIHPHYLYRFLAQRSVRRAAKENFTGSAGQARVPISFMEELEIPVPPTNEQRRIVAKLETLLGKVDACQRRLAKIPRLLKRFRQSVLAAACSGRLTADWREENPNEEAAPLVQELFVARQRFWESRELAKMAAAGKRPNDGGWKRKYKQPFAPSDDGEFPETWKQVTVSQVAFLDQGFAFKSSEFAESGIKLLRGENLEPGKLRWSDTKCWPKEKLAGLEHLLIEEGEIILALDRPMISSGLKLARAASADLPCVLVQRMMRFKMVESKLTTWLHYNLRIPDFVRHLTAGLTGSDLPHVTGTGVAEYTFGLPPFQEQNEIVRRVEQLFTFADQLEARFTKAQAHVDKLTQSLLAKAFRGELVPQDPNDEPASALLARIRSETNGAEKPARRKIRA